MRLVLVLVLSTAAGCGLAAVPGDVGSPSDAGLDTIAPVDAFRAMDAWRAPPSPDAWIDPHDASRGDGFVPGPPLDAARPIAPLSGSRVPTRRPTLTWQRGAGADAARVELCADRACTNVIDVIDTTDTRGVPSVDLPPGIVFWRVVPRTNGVDTTPSATWRIEVPFVSAPADNAWGHATDFDSDGLGDVIAVLYWESPTLDCSVTGCNPFDVVYGSTIGAAPRAPVHILDRERTYSVEATTDVNGDGYSDAVVIGWALDTGSQQAALDVYLGSDQGLRTSFAQSFPEPPGFARWLSAYEARSVTAVGDVDGDGYGDVVLAARTTIDMPPWQGATHFFLYSGGPDGLGAPLLLPMAYVPTPTSYGPVVSAAGDQTGDGRPDLAIACDGEITLYPAVGDTFASDGAHVTTPTDPAAGQSLGGPADLDGDGWPDLMAYALNAVTIHFGSSSGLVRTAGPYAGVLSASAFGSPGDVDGDGIEDLVMTSSGYVDIDAPYGAVLLRLGASSEPATDVTTRWPEHITDPGALWLAAMWLPRDFDGDAHADLIAGYFSAALVHGTTAAPYLTVDSTAFPSGL